MRRAPGTITRDALTISAAVGIFGISFGVLARGAGLSIAQTQAMSLLVFTGASQFAAVGVITAGGSVAAAVTTGLLLGSRNLVYGMSLGRLLAGQWPMRALAAHLVVDETAAMAIAQEGASSGRRAFWITAVAEFTLWNLGTLIGAVGGEALTDPEALGLDVAFPAGFVALAAPQLRSAASRTAALGGGLLALSLVPVVPAGLPVLAAVLAVVVVSVARAVESRRRAE